LFRRWKIRAQNFKQDLALKLFAEGPAEKILGAIDELFYEFKSGQFEHG